MPSDVESTTEMDEVELRSLSQREATARARRGGGAALLLAVLFALGGAVVHEARVVAGGSAAAPSRQRGPLSGPPVGVKSVASKYVENLPRGGRRGDGKRRQAMEPGHTGSPLFDITAFWTKEYRIGCDNWAAILLENATFPNPLMCGQACDRTPGCVGFGYQPSSCSGPTAAVRQTCYLWADECITGANPCYDQYTLRNTKPKPWVLTSTRAICKDSDSISMVQSAVPSVHACGLQCHSTQGCVAFNYYDSDCGIANQHRGTCVLYDSMCEEQPDDCWDMYSMEVEEEEAQGENPFPGLNTNAEGENSTIWCDDSPEQLCRMVCVDPVCPAGHCAMRQGSCCHITCQE